MQKNSSYKLNRDRSQQYIFLNPGLGQRKTDPAGPGATARVGRLDFIGGLIFIEAQRCPLRYLGFTDTFLDHVRPYQEQGAYTVLSCKLYVSF